MSKFKTADARQREKNVADRTQRGLGYLNGEFMFQTFQPQDGDNSVRIVPPLGDDPHASLWGLDVWVYYLNGKPYLSPQTFDRNARDPVMEKYNKLKQEDVEAAKAFKGTKRSLTFVLDMLNDEELKVWAAPTTVIDEILKVAKNRKNGELIPVEDPKDGRVIFFNKAGTGINTKYSAFQLDTEKTPLDDSIADQLVHFKDLLVVPSAEDLDDILADFNPNAEGGSRPQARTRRPEEAATQAAQEDEPVATKARDETPAEKSPPSQLATGSGNSPDDVRARVAARLAAKKAASGE